MKLWYISTMNGAEWGGSEMLWSDSAASAARHGHEVNASIWRWPERRAEVQRLRQAGVRVIEHGPLASGGAGRKERWCVRHPALAARVGAWVSRFGSIVRSRPDVVCFSLGETYSLVRHFEYRFLARLLHEHGIPYVVVCQLSLDQIDHRDWRSQNRLIFERAAGVFFVSQYQLALVERQLGVQLPHGRVVRNPVNLRQARQLPWPPESPARFACVARLHMAHKGHDVLLAALARVPWRDEAWQLRLYGRGPDEEAIRRQVIDLGLQEHVTLAGQITSADAVWADHHLCLLASRFEGTPLAMVEAMISGRACVSTNVGGIPEWVQPGKSGFLAESENVESLAAALNEAWRCRSRWQDMGAEAHRRALSLIDPDPGQTLLGLMVDAARGNRRRHAPTDDSASAVVASTGPAEPPL